MLSKSWTAAELDIVRALAMQVPAMTLDQIRRGWFQDDAEGDSEARRTVHRLSKARLLDKQLVEAEPLFDMPAPLFSWRPGEPSPTDSILDMLVETVSQRRHDELRSTTVYVASAVAGRLYGAFVEGRFAKTCETSHNLQLAETYLTFRSERPVLGARWHGEAAFPKLGYSIRGMKDPDAFVVGEGGAAELVIEYVGRYDRHHLRQLHNHCAGQGAERLRRFCLLDKHSLLAQLYSTGGTAYELW